MSLVTTVEAGLARPSTEGLKEEMVVTSAPPDGANADPRSFEGAVRDALVGEREPRPG